VITLLELTENVEYEALWDKTMENAKKWELGSGIIYDLRKKHGYHGSCAMIRCYDSGKCDVEIEAVLPKDTAVLNVAKTDLEMLGCYVYDVHIHPEPEDTYHVHAICSVNVKRVNDILKYIKNL
jgi:hypothetical protein